MSFPYEGDIKDLIRSTLLSFWRGDEIDAFIEGFSDLLQEIEDLHLTIRQRLDIEEAEGLFLDILGGWVQEPRGDLEDDDYRKFIQAKVEALAARGTVPELIQLTETLTSGLARVYPEFPAGYRVEITVPAALGDLRVERIKRLFATVSPAGVGKTIFEGNENFFRFDDDSRGLDLGELGRIL